MMTSSNGNISALLVLCKGNPPVTDGFPSQRPVTRSFDVFFDLRLNKRLGKQSRRRWFETSSRSSRRHCNVRSHCFVIHAEYNKYGPFCLQYCGFWLIPSILKVYPANTCSVHTNNELHKTIFRKSISETLISIVFLLCVINVCHQIWFWT